MSRKPIHAPHVLHRGPKTPPTNPDEAELQALDKANRQTRRHITKKIRAFIARYVEAGRKNAHDAAKDVGLSRPWEADKLAEKYADLIEAEWLRRRMGQQMEVDEALELVAGLARATSDEKVKHAALRTVLEVHGVLTGAPRVDRREAMRTIHSIVAAIKEKVKDGGKLRMRLQERVVEVSGEDQAKEGAEISS